MLYEIKFFTREKITDLCFYIIKIMNKYKDRCLAKRLNDLADYYDP